MALGRYLSSAAVALAVARHDRGPGPVQRCDRMTWRVDASRKVVHPNGAVDVPGVATRAGIFVYDEDQPPTRELRPVHEVLDPESLATLVGAPVTIEHPGQGQDDDQGLQEVTAENYRAMNHGTVLRVEPDQDGLVLVWVRLSSERVLAAIGGGKVELSCGYTAVLVDPQDPEQQAMVGQLGPEPGVAANGERYDLIQTQIRYNHLAVVDQARAGPVARLHLDGKAMKKTKITLKRDGKTQTHQVPTWLVDAAKPEAVDPDKRQDAGEVLEVMIEGMEKALVLPKEMVDQMLAAVGMGPSAGDPAPSAPEPTADQPDIDPDMMADAEDEPAVDGKQDAMTAATIKKMVADGVRRALATALPGVTTQIADSVTASARERAALDRGALPVLGQRFDYAAHDEHGIAVAVLDAAESPRLDAAKALAAKARKGDARAAGRLAQLMDDVLDQRRDAQDSSGNLGTSMFELAGEPHQDSQDDDEQPGWVKRGDAKRLQATGQKPAAPAA